MELIDFQPMQLRDENDNIVQEGSWGKDSEFCNAQNTGILDYIGNNLQVLQNAVQEQMGAGYATTEQLNTEIADRVAGDVALSNRIDTIESGYGGYTITANEDNVSFALGDDSYIVPTLATMNNANANVEQNIISSIGELKDSKSIDSNETGNEWIIFAKAKQYDGKSSTLVSFGQALVCLSKYNGTFLAGVFVVSLSGRYSPYVVARKIAGASISNYAEFGYYLSEEEDGTYYNFGVKYSNTYRSPVNVYPICNRRETVTWHTIKTYDTEPTGWTAVNTQQTAYAPNGDGVGDSTHPVYVSGTGAVTQTTVQDITDTITWNSTYVSNVNSSRTSLKVHNGIANLQIGVTLTAACGSASSYVTIGTTTYRPKSIVYGVMGNGSNLNGFPCWINTSGNILVYAKGQANVAAAWYSNLTWIDE